MNNKKREPKKGGKLIKVLILALVLTVVAVSAIVISDMFGSDDEPAPEIQTVTVTVSGTDIYLNGSEKLSLQALDDYLTERFANNNYCTIALINDTKNPADTDTYNNVVELLGEFGIRQDKLTLPATDDELKPSSFDEK